MKTGVAAAFEAKQPLAIVELDGPKGGEVLVQIMATGICYTDAYKLEPCPILRRLNGAIPLETSAALRSGSPAGRGCSG